MKHRVLIIEDNADLANMLPLHLNDLECDVEVATEGSSGLKTALGKKFDLIILDLMLPNVGGMEICRRLRSKKNYTPILMLTSKSSEFDRVSGLDTGADDYLTKPFSLAEFLARVKAILRRRDVYHSKMDDEVENYVIDNITINGTTRVVKVNDKVVTLTPKEFELLLQFARSPGRVFTRSQLLDLIWGFGHEGYEHTVNSHINRLRAKIEADPKKPEHIVTVWGVGYKFLAQQESL